MRPLEVAGMAEYIEREALISAIEDDCPELVYYSKRDAIDCVKAEPAADVAEVRHGRWIVHFDHFAPYQKCSVCGFETPLVATENEAETCRYKHCPECTARMDKEADHD